MMPQRWKRERGIMQKKIKVASTWMFNGREKQAKKGKNTIIKFMHSY